MKIIKQTITWLLSILFISGQSYNNYEDLHELFFEWRKFENPPLLNGAPDYTKSEIINESGNGLKNQRMSIGMARNNLPHTGSSQFYINLVNNYSLDPIPTRWGYAVFGDVIDGMNVVDAIGHSATESKQDLQNVPVAPIIILKARIIGE